jgi:glutamate formiminotransferase / 5-formyltetrahydrofolate cyclo-ligase
VLECVVNVSEGRRPEVLADLAEAAAPCLLDIHRDADHHRSVFTLAGPAPALHAAVSRLAAETVACLDMRGHHGAHPRIGALDVVPWVALDGWPVTDGPLTVALEARDSFARWAGDTLGLPCFLYGPERTLPDVRRTAWVSAWPDTGPMRPHPRAGAAAVGARPLLVAYNIWLADPDLVTARIIAAELRGPSLRALGLQVGRDVQVSCNLIQPAVVGPEAVFDAVASRAVPARAELVGLLPAALLDPIPTHRWPELDLDPSRTIEARLEEAGLHPRNLGHQRHQAD